MSEAKEWFDSINWDKIENTKVLSLSDDDKIIATLEIRGEEFTLLFYDYYMLHAILLTDGANSNQVDYDYVVDLRTAIREDMNHFHGILTDTLYDYDAHNLIALDKIIEIFNDYTEQGSNCDFDIKIRAHELEAIMIQANS